MGDRAKTLGRRGGLKSGVSRNLKNFWRDALTKVGSEKLTINGKRISRFEAESIKMHNLILQGNVQAFLAVRDTMGEKPVDRIASTDGRGNDLITATASDDLLEIMEKRRVKMNGEQRDAESHQ